MDVAWTLQVLLPGPKYLGSCLDNQQASYDALLWQDERTKPTWAELLAAWPAAQKTMVPLLVRLTAIFDAIPTTDAPVNVRAYFRGLEGAVKRCLEAAIPDVEAAKFIIQTATLPGDTWVSGYTLPTELAGFQQALLAEFN